MESEIAQQQEAMKQQQIQALLANVEELTRQNEELRKTMESQSTKRWQISENYDRPQTE